jgi:excisionase family DNA binding protein
MDKLKKEIYSVPEVAGLLNISRQAVFKKINNGQIKAEKVGRNFVIYGEDIKDLVFDELTEKLKNEIDSSVEKTIKEYGEVLKKLGKE